LLTNVGTPKIHGKLHPRKIVERVKLGEPLAAGEPPRLGVTARDVRDAFFGFLEPPRITSASVLRKAIVQGVSESIFGYCSGSPTLGADGKYQVAVSKVAFGRSMTEDEVDLDNGFIIAPSAVPIPEPAPTGGGGTGGEPGPVEPTPPTGGPPPSGGTPPAGGTPVTRTSVRITFPASRDDVFKAFPAIANLADKSDSGKLRVTIDGQSSAGYDANWLRNAVQEPLDEANIDGLEIN